MSKRPPLNMDALDEVRGILGISRPVHIEAVAPLPSGADGQYLGLTPNNTHHIVHGPERLDARLHGLLVHELVHASQCEREASAWHYRQEYSRQLREAGLDPKGPTDDAFYTAYRAIPFEREAYYVQARAFGLPWLFATARPEVCIMSHDLLGWIT